jgi:16S rRNA processing protein RimM
VRTREVAVGVVRRPFGLQGAVFVHPDADLEEPFPARRTYRVAGAAGPDAPAQLTVADSFVHRGLQVVRFAEVGDREAALALRDAVLWRQAQRDDVDPDTFWADDLVGKPVVDSRGRRLGAVAGVLDGTAHDYLAVTDREGNEVLVPAVAEMVTVERERVVVRPPRGLFDPASAEEA